MKVTKIIPTKDYPYLAVWVGKDQSLDPKLLHNIELEDIVLISMVEVENSDKQPYVQYVLGNRTSLCAGWGFRVPSAKPITKVK